MNNSFAPIPVPEFYTEPLAGVLNALRLRPLEDNSLSGESLPQVFSHIYGGQLLAQGALAAAALIDEDRQDNLYSLHTSFLRAGSTEAPIELRPTLLHQGRSFSTVQANAWQNERHLMQLNASFQVPEKGLEFPGATPPEVPGPEGLTSNLEIFALIDNPVAKFLGRTSAFEVRHVDGDLYGNPRPGNDHRIWIRPRTALPVMRQVVHRAMLAYVLDQLMMEPMLRKHRLSWATDGLALASLDHAMWFHENLDINDWHLLVFSSPHSSGALGLSQVEIFNRSGDLLASATQQAMIRIINDGGRWAFDGRGIPNSEKA
ncbi:hypothetical protein BSR29_02750 [Boudabousia liubingyangii]|uniref:Acyl-CoA thioesterase II n=1 Tax=Boudabousia liubingyangii TaxID=1921764 RepID=A0A1Q5PML7_9ACTO|nr:acyl-CoA thioesterase domain-containing protein [Boudabousia liubingyangii]OKL48794.1 hypothetical protein BSR29_02750 [Boudabousia liubingyangii]